MQPSAAKHKTEFIAVKKDERRLFVVNVKTMEIHTMPLYTK